MPGAVGIVWCGPEAPCARRGRDIVVWSKGTMDLAWSGLRGSLPRHHSPGVVGLVWCGPKAPHTMRGRSCVVPSNGTTGLVSSGLCGAVLVYHRLSVVGIVWCHIEGTGAEEGGQTLLISRDPNPGGWSKRDNSRLGSWAATGVPRLELAGQAECSPFVEDFFTCFKHRPRAQSREQGFIRLFYCWFPGEGLQPVGPSAEDREIVGP
jgi:hypothetical protein